MLMKMLKTAILSVLLLSFLSVPVLAQSQTRIATVDMQKLFNDYWKKKTAQVALDNHKAELRKEITDLSDGLTKSQADYKTLVEAANDQTLSAASARWPWWIPPMPIASPRTSRSATKPLLTD